MRQDDDVKGSSEPQASCYSDESEPHERFMKMALLLGEKALEIGETPVLLIGSGMNDANKSMNGTRHAEFLAIEEVLKSYPSSIFRQTNLYVTVEPCIMCASALRQYQVRRVYFGCSNERFGGVGSARHKEMLIQHPSPGIDPPYPVYGGLFHEEAIMLLRRFYIQENDRAPNPRSKTDRELNLIVGSGKVSDQDTN
ncbi:Cytidine deaminase-like protein [Elaphomyces granulatus]